MYDAIIAGVRCADSSFPSETISTQVIWLVAGRKYAPQGISDAFIDAEALTTALDDGWSGRSPLDAALAEYQSRCDQRAKPMYEFMGQMVIVEPPAPEMQRLCPAP